MQGQRMLFALIKISKICINNLSANVVDTKDTNYTSVWLTIVICFHGFGIPITSTERKTCLTCRVQGRSAMPQMILISWAPLHCDDAALVAQLIKIQWWGG